MANFLDNILGGIGSAVQGASNFVGQEINQFSPAVQNFAKQAGQALSNTPNSMAQTQNVAQDIGAIPGMAAGLFKQGANYFNPESNQGQNFWSTPVAQQLGQAQQGVQQVARARLNIAQPFGQAVQNTFGGNNPTAQIAGFGANVLASIPESIANVPSQIAQSGTDIGTDIRNRQFGGTRALGDLAEAATPLATIATFGGAGSLLKEVAGDTWKMAAVKGLFNGMTAGGGFGALQGLETNKDAGDFGSQFQQSIPHIVNGMLTGGVLGSLLAPAGKFFFGGKEGEAATLSQNGLVPPQTIEDAHRILGVGQGASLDNIRGAYQTALNEFHPQNGGTDEAVTVLNNAYEMATRNNAPTIINDGGQLTPQWSNDFGGRTLSPQQVIAARKAASQNEAFQARIENLKSGNVPIKDNTTPEGQFSKDDFLKYGHDVISPEGRQEIAQRTQQAQQNQPAFQDILDTVSKDQGVRSFSNIKDPFVSAQKVVDHRVNGEKDYHLGDVNDFLRGTIVAKDQAGINGTVDALKSELADRGLNVVSESNYFKTPQKSGYEGYHLDVQMPDGQIGEIQVHTPQSLASAQLTHDIYAKYDQAVPPTAAKALKNIQKQIKGTPTDKADLTARAYSDQQVAKNKFFSPMESDYTGDTENHKLAMQMVANQQEPAGALDGEVPSDQELAVNQLKQQNPQLDYSELDKQVAQPKIQAQQDQQTLDNHYLQNLVRQRDSLQAKISVPQQTSSPEVEGLIKMKTGLQQEVDSSQAFLKNYDLQDQYAQGNNQNLAKPSEIRAHIKELKASMKNIDTQVKDMQAKIKVQSSQSADQLKGMVDDLNEQIGQEQSRLRVQQVAKAPAEPKIQTEQAPAEEPKIQTTNAATTPSGGQQQTFTGKQITDYDQNGILKEPERNLVGTLLDATRDWYGTGRQMSKTVEGRTGLGQQDIAGVYRNLMKELPDTNSRSNVLYALDGSTDPKTLTAQEKNVFDRINIIHQVTYDVAKKVNPDLQPIENYAPSFATGIDKGSAYAKQGLSTSGPQMMHREIRAFMPAEGGDTRLGTKDQLGLTESGKTSGVFEDKDGNQFIARDATMKEKEGLGINYETDLAKAEARHLTNVLRSKENFGLRQALQGKKYAQLRSNPGEPMPAGFRKSTVMPDFGWQKDVAKGLDQTIPQEKGEGLGNDILNFYKSTESNIVRDSLLNPVGHIPNITGQAMFAVSDRNALTGVPRWIGNLGEGFKTMANPDGKQFRYWKSLGSNIGDEAQGTNYGPNAQNVLQKGAGILNKVQQKVTGITWKYDTIAKTAAYKTLIDQGADPFEAVHFVDNYMGDYKNINPGLERTISTYGATFYPWLKTEMQPYLQAKGHPQALIGGLAWSLGSIAAVNVAYQKITGNPDAKLGLVGGTGKLTMDAAEQFNPQALGQDYQKGKLPPLIYSHLGKPLLRTAVQEAADHNLLTGKQITNPNADQSANLKARGMAALGMVNPTAGAFSSTIPATDKQGNPIDAKKSVPEAIAGSFGFSSTPHLQGFQAAPNIGFMNTPNAKPGTGMAIIHTQDKVMSGLSSQQQANLQQIKAFESQGNYSAADQLIGSDPKLFDAISQMKQVEAQTNDVPVDPTYDSKNKAQAQEYMKFSNLNLDEQSKYLAANPDILNFERQRDMYNQNPTVQQYKQQQAKSLGYNYKPYTANPLFATGQNGQPQFSNTDIAAYKVYQGLPSQSLSDSATKQSFLANHPQVMAAQIANAPYQLQKLQDAWNSRPTGQSAAEFAAKQKSSLFGGVDQTGKVIPAYNIMDEPKYQLFAANPQAGSIYNIYKAAMTNKDYTKADPIAAKYPWIAQVDAAQKAYTQAHPYNSESNHSLGGLGIDFSASKTGSGGSYGSSSYYDNYLEKQFMYNAMHEAMAKFPTMPAAKPEAPGATYKNLQLKPGAINQSLYPIKAGIPKMPTSDINTAPKLKAINVPQNVGKIKFQDSGRLPQETVQAGRVTRIGGF